MSNELNRLIEIMRRLRDANNGCPWDLKQDHKSLAPYLLEEAYEAVDAIEHNDTNHMVEELGDVLLQIVFHARLGSESALFDFDTIAKNSADKMVERHPHVFGERSVNSAEEVLKNWEKDKAAKRQDNSVFDGVNKAQPALPLSFTLHQRVARQGFDWSGPDEILAKLREEIGELIAEIRKGEIARGAIEEELGDVMAVLVNLARHFKIDPERAMRLSNRKFESRIRAIEAILRGRGLSFEQANMAEKQKLWDEVKKKERRQ